jgi:predicted membrane channel-forming protein YqfA (hemolysin III family)
MLRLIDAIGIRPALERILDWLVADGGRVKSVHKLGFVLAIVFGVLIGYMIAETLPDYDFKAYTVGFGAGVLVCFCVRTLWELITWKDSTK